MIVIDEDNGYVALQGLANRSPLTTITRKRRDSLILPVQFLTGGVTRELAAGSTGTLGIKEPGKYSDAYMAADLTWTQQGSGANAVYYFSASLNSELIEAKFTSDAIPKVDLQLELTWTENGDNLTTSNDIALIVKNRYIRGDENAPVPAFPALANWGNTAFRFGATGEPEFYNADIPAWVRLSLAGNPSQTVFTQL